MWLTYNATNSTNDRPRCGRPQVTTARQNRLMVRQHLQNRSTRATETARQTVGTHLRPISADTVRHRLVASNLRCDRSARGPVPTPRHRQECSLCCGFKRGIASVSKLILTIIEIFKPFIPIPKHENHEHLTIQNCYCKVCPTKGGRFECSTTSDKNHPSGNSV
jgi:hypothetical protein